MCNKAVCQISVFPIAFGLVLLQVSGFAHGQGEEIAPTETVIEIPDHNEDARVQRGETIVAKARVSVYQGIRLLSRIDGKQKGGSGAGRPTVTIEPQFLVARTEDKRWTYYTGNVGYTYAGLSNVTASGSGGSQNRDGGLRMRKDDPNDIEIWVSRYRGRGFISEEPFEFERATIGAGAESSVANELVYDGRDSSAVRIIYREHAGASTEPAHEETVIIDLSGGSEISVKGVRLEILAADADSLHYRVLENFE